MSKQKNADYIFAFNSFDDYNNKSALLLRLRQALADNGYLIIVQETTNINELNNYFSILEKTHGVKPLYQSNISSDVFTAIERMSEKNVWLSRHYSSYQSAVNNIKEYSIIVKVFQNV